MFMNMGVFLGIALATVILTMLFRSIRIRLGKNLQATIGFQLVGIIMAILVAIVAIIAVGSQIQLENTSGLVGGEILFALSSFELVSAVAFLFGGLPSMLLQLPLFVVQIMSSGAILSKSLMPSFYKWLTSWTPMYAGTQSFTKNLFNIGNATNNYMQLVWIFVVGLVLVCLLGMIRYRSTEAKTLDKMFKV